MEKKKIAKVVITQVLVIGMCCALAFAGEDIFTRAESAVGGYEESVWSLIQKLVVVIGLAVTFKSTIEGISTNL